MNMIMLLGTFLLGAVLPDDGAEKIVARVQAHEERFRHCQLQYSNQAYNEKADGPLAPVGLCGDFTYYASGNRQRLDTTARDPNAGKQTVLKTTDGERAVIWSFSDVDSAGQAVLQPADRSSDAGFPAGELCPLATHPIPKGKKYEVEDDGSLVRVRWEENSRHFYVLECREFNGDLCPVRFRSLWKRTGEPDNVGVELLYSYDASHLSGGFPYPARIDLRAPGHKIHDIFTTGAADFSPKFSDDLFTLQFKERTWVTDRATGTTSRHHKSDANPRAVPQETQEIANPLATSWSERFNRVYRLDEGEVLRRVPTPFIPERLNYCRAEESNAEVPYCMSFEWDGKTLKKGTVFMCVPPSPDTPLLLSHFLEQVAHLRDIQYGGPAELLEIGVTGDWIKRKGADTGQILKAFENILKEQFGKDVRFEQRPFECDAIVASGKYTFTPLPGVRQPENIHVFADEFAPGSDNEYLSYVGVGSLLHMLEDIVRMPLIDETTPDETTTIRYKQHPLKALTDKNATTEARQRERDALLQNVSRQTGLAIRVERRAVPKWFVGYRPKG